MTWDELADAITARYPDVASGKMFGMPCLKRSDGKIFACLWKDGGLTVKLVHEAARTDALAIPGAGIGSHAFDPSRQMLQWVHVPAAQAGEWQRLVELALSIR